MVRKSALGLVFGLALCLGVVVAPALAMDVQFELGVWNPNIQYGGDPAYYQVWKDTYLGGPNEAAMMADSENPPYTYPTTDSESWERHAPKLEESKLLDNVLLDASFGVNEESRIALSFWNADVSGTVGSDAEPLDIDWYDLVDVGIGLPATTPGHHEEGAFWPVDVDELVYPVASYSVKASSFEVAYDHRVSDTGSLKVDVAAGLRSISFKDEAKSAVRFHSEESDGELLLCADDTTYSVVGESETNAFGPSLRVKADAALTDRISVVANLGYSYLFGESTGSSSYGELLDEIYYVDGVPSASVENLEEVSFADDLSAQIPVIDAQVGVKFALTDAASFSIGYKASRWIGVPMAPKFDWHGEMPVMNEKQDIGFSGLNAGLIYRF